MNKFLTALFIAFVVTVGAAFAQGDISEQTGYLNSTSRTTFTIDPRVTNIQIVINKGIITRGNCSISYDYGNGFLWNATKTSVVNATKFTVSGASVNQVSFWPSGNWNVKNAAGKVQIILRTWR